MQVATLQSPHTRGEAIWGDIHRVKAVEAVDCDERGDRAFPFVLRDDFVHRHIGEAIGVICKKAAFAGHVLADARQPLADVGVQTGVDEGDAPVVHVAGVQLDPLAALRQGEIVRQALAVVQEILTDHVATVAQTEDEILVSEVRIVAHQVPNDRTHSDVHERLGHRIGMLAQARAESTAKQNHFHA